jgi:hypothetical protein
MEARFASVMVEGVATNATAAAGYSKVLGKNIVNHTDRFMRFGIQGTKPVSSNGRNARFHEEPAGRHCAAGQRRERAPASAKMLARVAAVNRAARK